MPVRNKLRFVTFLSLYSNGFIFKCCSKYCENQLMLRKLFPYAEFCDNFQLKKAWFTCFSSFSFISISCWRLVFILCILWLLRLISNWLHQSSRTEAFLLQVWLKGSRPPVGGLTGCPETQWALQEVEVRRHLWKPHSQIPLLQAGSARTVCPGVCPVRFE